MGLRDTRKKAIESLRGGKIQMENRADEKNLLKTGEITVQQVIEMLNKTNGKQYSTSPHHLVQSVEVCIFKPIIDKTEWYIKLYFLEPDCWFISVHPSEKGR